MGKIFSKFILLVCLIGLSGVVYSAPPMTIWNRENTASLRVSTTTGGIIADITGSIVGVNNFPTDYPDALSQNRLSLINSTADTLFKQGQLIGNTSFGVNNFPAIQSVSQSGFWDIRSATVTVSNPVTSVSVTGSTVTVIPNTSRIYHTAIRNDPAEVDRYLRINSFNGLDIRLQNSVGTLISAASPLPTEVIRGTVTVGNFPAVQSVSQSGVWDIRSATVTITNPVTSVAVNNFPAIQNVDIYSVYTSTFVDSAISGLVKSGGVDLARVIIGQEAAGTLTIRDGTTIDGKIISRISTATPRTIEIGVRLTEGLYIEKTGSPPASLTIVYR